jgi:hypothetical protein
MKNVLNYLCLTALIIICCNACKKDHIIDPKKPEAPITVVGLPMINSVNLANYSGSSFSQEESFMPYYLKYFNKLANAVVDSGPYKGYIDLHVWRGKDVNKPYDARIMENIMSLVWFYTQPRTWNPYYNDPALKARIEAALTFWSSIQNTDGRFSEYGPNEWFIAPTAFATKFVGRALYLLADVGEKGPQIERNVLTRAIGTYRKALYGGFTVSECWNNGRTMTNQYANFWGGALMYLQKWPDPEINTLFRNRLTQSIEEFQSPCGFMYEFNGPDWGYTLDTWLSDMWVAYNFAKGTDLQDVFVQQTSRWFDWVSYNALLEPGTDCYFLNMAIETRQKLSCYEAKSGDLSGNKFVPQAEFAENARAFQLSREEMVTFKQDLYNSMISKYPNTNTFNEGDWAYTPYNFVHLGMCMWQPTQAQKDEAIKNLPYMKNERFTEVRYDPRSKTAYTFYKKPSYYAIFNSGKIVEPSQRYGLGLVWNPNMGTTLMSQAWTDDAGYGTKAALDTQVYESKDLFPLIKANGKILNVDGPQQDLDADSLTFTYPLGNFGIKTVRMLEDKIAVSVQHSGSFTEILPLVVWPTDVMTFSNSSIVVRNSKGATCTIQLSNSTGVTKKSYSSSDLKYKNCVVFEVNAFGKLDYEIKF